MLLLNPSSTFLLFNLVRGGGLVWVENILLSVSLSIANITFRVFFFFFHSVMEKLLILLSVHLGCTIVPKMIIAVIFDQY